MFMNNIQVDNYIAKSSWHKEFALLRTIISNFQLTETFKWGVPCYTINDKNVLLIHGFKDYCAILFVKGSLINDHGNQLVQQTTNVQAGRQLRFHNCEAITQQVAVINDYVQQAIIIEQQGREVVFKAVDEYQLPIELEKRFIHDPAFKAAFQQLTPGRQRAYILYFSQPKQSKTREQRIDKSLPGIFEGKGLNEE
jgi:uncharacterized protein YdeI (YjbR/CyaY-like superfamily)